ncbi:MAG: shikimate dehydrogenase [Candidatus Omnitrophota bacterium]
MRKFGFIIHPIGIRNIYNFFPPSRILPQFLLKKTMEFLPPFTINHVLGIRSASGLEIEGYFIACPLLSKQILGLDEGFVIDKILAAAKIAERLKVDMLGLGALAGTVGQAGKLLAQRLDVPITNGTTYAGGACLETIFKAVEMRKINLRYAKIAIIGATNSIGKICAYTLSKQAAKISLAAKNQERLSELISKLKIEGPAEIENSCMDVNQAIKNSDIVIFTASAIEVSPEVEINQLKPGAIICDIPVPRNITLEIFRKRPDLLIIDGAAIEPPCEIKLTLDTGLTKGQIYACMAETIILTLEGKFEDFSVGWEPSLEKVELICALAKKHGFKPAFTSFGNKI